VTDIERRDQLAARLGRVRDQISAAAADVGRSADEITLVVVTKTWPTGDIRLLCELGVRDIGENKHPEAERKAAELEQLPLTWHFIGQIQSNKAPRIARYADLVHSVDSTRLAHRLNAGAHQADRVVDCLVQVNLDPAGTPAGRGGIPTADVDEIERVAEAIETAGALRLRGVMGVAPLEGDALTAYARLAAVWGVVRSTYPDATLLSAGMSGDFPEAIRMGATHVRVGSAILGQRPPLG
jgi:pyridoxal phosphate enzyme (YggS family)